MPSGPGLVEYGAEEARMARDPMACPLCGERDYVQKVTSIYYTDQDGFGARVAPPKKPELRDIPKSRPPQLKDHSMEARAILIVISVVVFFILIQYLRSTTDNPNDRLVCAGMPTIGIFIIGIIWIAIYQYDVLRKYRMQKLNNRIIDWQMKMDRWEQLYYCSRDDVIFVPGEGTALPVRAT